MALALSSLANYLAYKRTLYFSHTTGEVFFRGKHLVHISKKDQGKTEQEEVVAISSIRRVVILGKPRLSSTVLYRLMRFGIAVDFLDIYGRPLGQLSSLDENSDLYVCKQEDFSYTKDALELMRDFLLAKCDNAREILRRKVELNLDWQGHRLRLSQATNAEELRGAEGYAARDYFSHWSDIVADFTWHGRQPHPAPDPVNLLLSFGYSMLHNRLASALRRLGLNPRLGIFHATRGRHCALASDLMEPLRPLVDATTLKLIRKHQLLPEHFSQKGERCVFTDKEAFPLALNAFEKMFAKEYSVHNFENNQWVEKKRTLNDCIDDFASGYLYRLSLGLAFTPVRFRQCATA